MAHRDDNENGQVDFDFEYYGYSDTLELTPGAPVIDSLEIAMINIDTPASLAGRITSSHPLDSTVVYLESPDDTSFLATARPDSLGDYSFSRLTGGEYRILVLGGSPARIEAEGPAAAEKEIAGETIRLRPGEAATRVDLPEPRSEEEPAAETPGPAGAEEPQVTP